MKKIYLLAFTAVAFAFSTSAQVIFEDDMETYAEGPVHFAHWSNWDGVAGAGDLEITEARANSGSQSGMIGGDGVQDAILLLDNKTSGSYTISWKAYIPEGKSAYMNFQGMTEGGGAGNGGNGVFISPNLVFNNVASVSGEPGTGGAYPNIDSAEATYTWSYPESTWFTISIFFDIDNVAWTMTIDGTTLPSQPFDDAPVLGGVDFYSFDPNNEFYIDDVVFTEGVVGVEDFTANNFNVYPNPVKDVLTIQTKTAVDQVIIYDILGKVVMTASPEAISPKINMSELSAGAYMVKVIIGNTSKTIKVVK